MALKMCARPCVRDGVRLRSAFSLHYGTRVIEIRPDGSVRLTAPAHGEYPDLASFLAAARGSAAREGA